MPWKHMLVSAIALLGAVSPGSSVRAQTAGLEQPDSYYLWGDHGQAWVEITWRDHSSAWVEVTVEDTAYDGWCAAIWIYADNMLSEAGSGPVEVESCGYGVTTIEYWTVWEPTQEWEMPVLHLEFLGYYPPDDSYLEELDIDAENPLAQ